MTPKRLLFFSALFQIFSNWILPVAFKEDVSLNAQLFYTQILVVYVFFYF